MSYREFAPPKPLAHVIECVWTRLPDPAPIINNEAAQQGREPVTHAILPDGAMDIISTYHPDGELDETFVVGSMTQPQRATLGNDALVGIRFLPGVGGTALGTNATAFTDGQIAIDDVLQNTAGIRDAFRALQLNAGSAHALHLFANSVGMEHRSVPTIVRQAAKRLGEYSVPVRVEQVAKELGVTRQHLARLFSAHSGLTPKLFAQICRVRAVLAIVQSRVAILPGRNATKLHKNLPRKIGVSDDSWSQLSAEFGYVDQSHLIAEVHAIIGQTPAAWQAAAGSNIPIVPVPVAPL
ncbi:MAG: AraC family transcriptional regulator [Gemmatimonas sp.]